MPTQRPFLGNFLAAFRAHSQPLPKPSTSLSSSAAVAASASIWTAAPQGTGTAKSASPAPESNMSSPKAIYPAKTSPYGAQSTTAQPERQLVSSYTPLEHNVSPLTHLPRSPTSPGMPVHGPQNKPPSYPTVQDVRRSRRGSDSSAEGYREVRTGGEKWFIGGLTATGEERYYKLSMVKRDKSSDRISTDQMSL
ncbi:uncharacterized protein MYCFIDRAFT_210349 [Pseudocercospora fijiensis CIRAD86]|uniref:Uncharacterized protein n=1 Tax=Pseudocercospora fijiensis (strain CIRAD86) TaxID=383855 RepID=M3A438_PSEFD|nr:uncharacterized protein MYCFIDRAFT_210349 [Pseudocercospora fijiensis CIRAD86]EME85879.1 hypothetical protein MYCFIDRAFT_210349 [Pseudocercospora fijiensis CIRAD86]